LTNYQTPLRVVSTSNLGVLFNKQVASWKLYPKL
jgi:hypothetical protein